MRAVVALFLPAVFACGEPPAPPIEVSVDDALKTDLQRLADTRLFFGHQSVGQNVLDGLTQLATEAGVKLAIVDAPIGGNGDPFAKITDFEQKLVGGAAPDAQLVAMKLCYVDFDANTNVDALVKRYQEAIARVTAARPGVRVLHVTTPLYARSGGVKSSIKRMIGGTSKEDANNAKRHAYNEGLRKAFAGEPLFDLATVESTRPDGTREVHDVSGQQVPMLWSGYTDDGGHLNASGKRVGARAFAQAVARAAGTPKPG